MEPKRYMSIVGNVGRDPETRQEGRVVEFSVAVTEGIGKFDQEKQKLDIPTRWYRVSAWDENLQRVARSLTVGARVAVKGSYSVYESKGVKYDQIAAFAIATVNEWAIKTPRTDAPAPKPVVDDELPF